MSERDNLARRLLSRHLHLQRWYAVVLFLWAMSCGGFLSLLYIGANGSPRSTDHVSLLDVFLAVAGMLWPPRTIAGALFVATFWLPFTLAPFGLTRPSQKELY